MQNVAFYKKIGLDSLQKVSVRGMGEVDGVKGIIYVVTLKN